MLSALLVLVTLTCLGEAKYSEKEGQVYAKLAAIGMCDGDLITSWSCKLCKQYPYLEYVDQIYDDKYKVAAYTGYDKNLRQIVVVWSGTQDPMNWIYSLDFYMADFNVTTRCKNCKIHEGFLRSYTSISGAVIRQVQKLMAKHSVDITIIGHGIGGSIAMVSTLFFPYAFPQKVKEVYTFGSARVGNENLAKYIHGMVLGNMYRVVHYKDIVPHYPPLDLNYFHSPTEVLYDEEMKQYKLCSGVGEDPGCSNQYSPLFSIKDHYHYWQTIDQSVCA